MRSMSISCWTMSEYSLQFFSLNARSLLSCTFLHSLICYSFECLVMIMNKCMNRLNERRPLTLSLMSPISRSLAKSASRAFLCCGSALDLRCLPSGSASSSILASFLSICGKENPRPPLGGVLPLSPLLVFPIIGCDAAPARWSSTDSRS